MENSGRLGIFVFYDKEGTVDRYVEYLLKELKKNVEELLVIVNGQVNEKGIQVLESMCNKVYIRKNEGFDAGAYADLLVKEIGKSELSKWEELVLCNDTFYGPFIPLKEIFRKMDEIECDFWGLDGIKRDFLSYIIPYFCVFRKELLRTGDLYDYFLENIYEKISNTADTYALFEVGLYHTLCKKGYKPATYVYTEEHLCKKSPDICVKMFHLPIWKKKFFSDENYDVQRCKATLGYLLKQGEYDISLIEQNVKRIYGINLPEGNENIEVEIEGEKYNIPEIVESDLEEFLTKNELIYIYGSGAFAKATYFVFKDKIKEFRGFIISENKEIGEKNVWGYPVIKGVKQIREGAIVVALNLNNSMQVKKVLRDREQVFYFWKERAESNGDWERKNR